MTTPDALKLGGVPFLGLDYVLGRGSAALHKPALQV